MPLPNLPRIAIVGSEAAKFTIIGKQRAVKSDSRGAFNTLRSSKAIEFGKKATWIIIDNY